MSFSTDVTFDNPIATDVSFMDAITVDGIPKDYTFHTYLDKIPKITIDVGELRLAIDHVPKITVESDVTLRLTEIPSVRTHLPADFSVGVSILGMELLCVRLCGEGQIITEPYKPNLCERCGQVSRDPNEKP